MSHGFPASFRGFPRQLSRGSREGPWLVVSNGGAPAFTGLLAPEPAEKVSSWIHYMGASRLLPSCQALMGFLQTVLESLQEGSAHPPSRASYGFLSTDSLFHIPSQSKRMPWLCHLSPDPRAPAQAGTADTCWPRTLPRFGGNRVRASRPAFLRLCREAACVSGQRGLWLQSYILLLLG